VTLIKILVYCATYTKQCLRIEIETNLFKFMKVRIIYKKEAELHNESLQHVREAL